MPGRRCIKEVTVWSAEALNATQLSQLCLFKAMAAEPKQLQAALEKASKVGNLMLETAGTKSQLSDGDAALSSCRSPSMAQAFGGLVFRGQGRLHGGLGMIDRPGDHRCVTNRVTVEKRSASEVALETSWMAC